MRQAYPEYDDSGVAWLGETPRHWDNVHLRRHLAIVNGGTPASSDEACWDGDAAWLTPDDLGRNSKKLIGTGRRSLTEYGLQNSSATLCPAGSVVVSTRAPIGHLAVTTMPAATNQGCRTLVPSESVNCDFAYYSLLASRRVLEALGKGSTFMELTPTDLGSHRIPLPPSAEQDSIASFLDRETARIDKLITMQESLIERLDEYRTVLITQVVTKGLPPEAAEAAGLGPAPRLKDSGVEWLGEVPEHWAVVPLRRAVILQRGHDLPSDRREPGPVPVVTSAGISGNHIEAAATGPAIVTGRYGSIGDFYTVEGAFWPLNTTLYSVELFGNDVNYLYFLLTSLKPLFLSNAAKSAVPGVDRNDLHDIRVVVPPELEQRAIVEHLDAATGRIDALRAKSELSIERLREYRSAVISAAVTGKIDVRDGALAGVAGGL